MSSHAARSPDCTPYAAGVVQAGHPPDSNPYIFISYLLWNLFNSKIVFLSNYMFKQN